MFADFALVCRDQIVNQVAIPLYERRSIQSAAALRWWGAGAGLEPSTAVYGSLVLRLGLKVVVRCQ
jgi:hypothetical protein